MYIKHPSPVPGSKESSVDDNNGGEDGVEWNCLKGIGHSSH